MIPAQNWARNFTVEPDDVEDLTSLLLEREQPLNTEALALALVEGRLAHEASLVQEQFRDAIVYNPSLSYNQGQRVIFPVFDYSIGRVTDIRPGNNPDYGDFAVIRIAFEGQDGGPQREFAAELTTPHELSEAHDDLVAALSSAGDLTAEVILAEAGDDILYSVEKALMEAPGLVQVAGHWFPKDLLAEVNQGHLHLAEAVLDINGGGPLRTDEILDQIGGLESGSRALQIFSLNNTLRSDDRFDEVGPTGEVLWYLRRLEPNDVQNTPRMLRYNRIEYDRSLLTPEMVRLEAEIGDELSDTSPTTQKPDQVSVILNYPHRRSGTLPLNANMRLVFPSARQSPRVFVALIDGQDGEQYTGWVVRRERYIYGLDTFYRKHRIPVGAFIHVKPGDTPGTIIVDFQAYRPRTEWVRLLTPTEVQIHFENDKRAIGAEYDDLMILGTDDLAGVDALFDSVQQQRRSLVSILRAVISSLARLSPQGTVHAKTIYSAINAVRRCPPGPIFATLMANPDFQDVGGPYWKLSDS